MLPPTDGSPHPFDQLTPDRIAMMLSQEGFETDGRIMALNSYENRVFQVGLESGGFAIAKFYRPGRWSDEAIQEEHAFIQDLQAAEIPVAPMLENHEGLTLFTGEGFRFSLSPRIGGRVPEIENLDTLEGLGRLMARVHAIGKQRPFLHRPSLNPETYGHAPAGRILGLGLVPNSLLNPYREKLDEALSLVDACFAASGERASIRLHADAYAGNILETQDGPLLLDFDDSRMGPRVQDLWMLAQGEDQERQMALMTLIEGYDTFESFDVRELSLIEALRTLRLIHYTDWLSARTQDPAFTVAFPHFGTDHYWKEKIVELEDQIERMQAPLPGLYH